MPSVEHPVKGLKEKTSYEFRVCAENKAGCGPWSEPSEPATTLVVGDAPALVEPLQNLTVVSPDSTVFTCKLITGEPRADVTWTRDGDTLISGDKYVTTYEGDVATLEIKDTKTSDAGDYCIEGKNKVGKFSSQGTLTVHGK